LHALLAPVTAASGALRRYLERREVPDLPTSYPDWVGMLMADVQSSVKRLDASLRSLAEQAARTPLTGMLHRRSGEERLAQDVSRAARGGGDLALAVLDLDQFKPVNDEYGHRAGDACLEHFASILRRNLRAGDWAATSSVWVCGRGKGLVGRGRSNAWPSSHGRPRWYCRAGRRRA
jgi:hypothetical protein